MRFANLTTPQVLIISITQYVSTGKSVSEALIIESVNPQYDERLFIELQEKYKLRTCVILNVKSKKFSTQHVLSLWVN